MTNTPDAPFYDLVVIGAGSGGVRGARIAAGHGAKVAVIEGVRVGGTCVLRGCVPKKLLVYASRFAHELEAAAGWGWQVDGARLDWAALIAAKNAELDRLEGIYRGLLDSAGVEIIAGWGRLAGPNRVAIALPEGGERFLSAGKILIATGGAPSRLAIPGAERCITSDEALDLPALPSSIAILGGGYIAVEFAGIFAAAGVDTHLIFRDVLPLRGFDRGLRETLAAEIAKKGVVIHAGSPPVAVDADGVTLGDGSRVGAGLVMMATGRRPLTAGLGLESADIETRAGGAIKVDDWSRTNARSVFAVGDVTDRINLTPVAIAEAHAFADTEFGNVPRAMERDLVASAIFSQPAAGTVGLSEESAASRYGRVDVYETSFLPMKYTLSPKPRAERERIWFKLLVDPATDKVVGCHLVGDDAPEILQIVAVALKCGATKRDFDRTIGIHPTAAEELVTLRKKTRTTQAEGA